MTEPMPGGPVLLTDTTTVRIDGPDRSQFLQGQLTQDVTAVAAGHSRLAGWATAKGRLLCVTELIEWRDAYWLPLPAEIAEAVTRRLAMFVLRADVRVEPGDVDVIGTYAGGDASANEGCRNALAADTSRALILAERGTHDAATTDTEALRRWRRADIEAGIPAVYAGTSETFTPQMVNLDCLGGISFTKGCYVGQEIVARTQNLGRIKRRMFRYRCPGTGLAPGDALYGADGVAGRVVSAVGDDGATDLLAVISLSERGKPLYADEARATRLEALALPYPIPEIETD